VREPSQVWRERLDRLTAFHGRLADLNSVWFPFVFLKPRPDQLIGPARRLSMTICFTCYGAVMYPVKQWLFSVPLEQHAWAIFTLKCMAFFAVWFRVVTVPLWNRRARQLGAASSTL